MTERNILMRGVVGSTAYGLAREGSDVDSLGIYAAPLDEVLGLQGPTAVQGSEVTHEPDVTLHEVGKYFSLALKGNPTVLELMYLPYWTHLTEAGAEIVRNRSKFLSEKAVRNAYGGYATQQANRLMRREEEGKEGFSSTVKHRTEKHARHCCRLLLQGEQLLQRGEMKVDVSEKRDFLFNMGTIAAKDPAKFYEMFKEHLADFDAMTSVLPEKPDYEFINAMLIDIRKGRWDK